MKSGMCIYRVPIEDMPRERLEQAYILLALKYSELEDQLANRNAAVARVISWANNGERDNVLDALLDPVAL